jgi:hypothetical protein
MERSSGTLTFGLPTGSLSVLNMLARSGVIRGPTPLAVVPRHLFAAQLVTPARATPAGPPRRGRALKLDEIDSSVSEFHGTALLSHLPTVRASACG